MRVRLATSADAAAIATIYNQGIEDRVGTFETELRTEAMVAAWFDDVHPIVVDESCVLWRGTTSPQAEHHFLLTRACLKGYRESCHCRTIP